MYVSIIFVILEQFFNQHSVDILYIFVYWRYNYLRISVSWVCVVRGRGCLIRSRHCRMSKTIMPIRITQTTNPAMIKISCQSTGINAKRHAWLKSRLPDEERDLLIYASPLEKWHESTTWNSRRLFLITAMCICAWFYLRHFCRLGASLFFFQFILTYADKLETHVFQLASLFTTSS